MKLIPFFLKFLHRFLAHFHDIDGFFASVAEWKDTFLEGGGEDTFLGGGGEIPFEEVRDACPKIQIKLLKETNLGVTQALFEPKNISLKEESSMFKFYWWKRSIVC